MTTIRDPQPPGIERSIAFWEQRHVDLAHSFAGGDPRYDDMGNLAFNAVRVGRILDLLGALAVPEAPRRILDAGCGTGWVTRSLASFGFQVDGIDSSASAVAACLRHHGANGRDSYGLSRLDTWAPAYLYDAVVSVDVLFHITEDSAWAASLINLASLVRSGGRLLLVDHDLARDHHWGQYQTSRARRRYVDLLAVEGFVHRRFVPYDFRSNKAGFHVFDRIA